MNFDSLKFAAVLTAAKAAAANSPKWLKAIERAAAALVAGKLIVTVLSDGHALVTSENDSYWVKNGHCSCKAAKTGHAQCYHKAGARLVELYEDAPAVEAKAEPKVPRITRAVEFEHTGARVKVVKCDGWYI